MEIYGVDSIPELPIRVIALTHNGQPDHLKVAKTLNMLDRTSYIFPAPDPATRALPRRILIAHESACSFFLQSIQIRLGQPKAKDKDAASVVEASPVVSRPSIS